MTTTGALDGRWAAAGPAGEDIAYRTQSLRFSGMELTLNEAVPFMTLFRLWLYAACAGWAVFFLFFFFGLIDLFSSIGSASAPADPYANSSGGGADLGTGAGLVQFGFILSFIVFWLVLLIMKVEEPVAEWKTLIEGKAAAAESSYAAIFHSLARRRIPVGVSASRVRSDVLAAESVNNRLVLTERSYVAYVSVFAFGTSLYVGWTMWRRRRGATIVGQFIKDLFGGLIGRAGIVNQMLRTERVRAMREAVHSAVREGVDAAVAGISMPIAATFGYEIPIEFADTPAVAPNPAEHASSRPAGPAAG